MRRRNRTLFLGLAGFAGLAATWPLAVAVTPDPIAELPRLGGTDVTRSRSVPVAPVAPVTWPGGPEPGTKAACDRYASVSGRDSNLGSSTAPYRTATRLVANLAPGQRGCLLPGTFTENLSIRKGGSPGSPITISSAPGPRATLAGILYIADSANDVVIADLNLNGTNSRNTPSPQINGDRVTLRANDITNGHTAICVVLGGSFSSYGRAVNPVIEHNRIHNCGRLPATNHDHGIYVEGSDGARILNNVIYDNADWGVHLYPDADTSYIANNVIDGNGKGMIFASQKSSKDHSSDGNIFEFNIVSNSTTGRNVEAWWGGRTGIGNIVRSNCLWDNGRSGLDTSGGGFVAFSNVTEDPIYTDRAQKDFRLNDGSPCAGMGPS